MPSLTGLIHLLRGRSGQRANQGSPEPQQPRQVSRCSTFPENDSITVIYLAFQSPVSALLQVKSPTPAALDQSLLHHYAEELGSLDTKQRLQRVLEIARGSKRMGNSSKVANNRVMGCTAQVEAAPAFASSMNDPDLIMPSSGSNFNNCHLDVLNMFMHTG